MNRLAYKSGYKFQVHDNYQVSTGIAGFTISTDYCYLDNFGTLTIYKGYSWDGASGPAIDTVTFIPGSLVHDCMYQLIEEGLLPFSYRLQVDELLITICKESGMNAVRRWWVKLAVNTFGARALEKRNPVLFAPEKP